MRSEIVLCFVCFLCGVSCFPTPNREIYMVNLSGVEVEIDVFGTVSIVRDGENILVNRKSEAERTLFVIKAGGKKRRVEIPESWHLDPGTENLNVMYISPGRNEIVLMPNRKLYVWPKLVGDGKPQVENYDDLLSYPEYQPEGFPLSLEE